MAGPHQAAGSSRNYGYGRSLSHAGRQALSANYGGGHFETVNTHASRFDQFAKFVRNELGIRDMALNDPQEALEAYALHVAQLANPESGLAQISVATGQNLISSAQVTLRALTGNDTIKVSPSRYVGERSNVRTTPPGSLDRSAVENATSAMRSTGLDRAAAVTMLARELGMRSREATLANLPRLISEAARHGQVNIIDGTKGGRDAPRWVPVTEAARRALQFAMSIKPEGSRNLLAPAESWKSFKDGELRQGRPVLKSAGIKGYHDLRSGRACERYQELTGTAAPCVTGQPPIDRAADQVARQTIAYELGHNRTDVTVSYIGGRS